MSLIGIVAEFNPLHSGHSFLINEAKKLGKVATIISSNFVQRGDTAIFDKETRAKSALMAGADIVLELPVLWSMSTAQNFALGAISGLASIGCDSLMFGSECGHISELEKAADVLVSEEFSNKIKVSLKSGETFAKIREDAAAELGVSREILKGANNNLAIEYIIATKKLGLNFKFYTLKRKGALHDEGIKEGFASASHLREKIKDGKTEEISPFVSKEIYSYIKEAPYSDLKNIENTVLGVLRMRTEEELRNLPDLSEGIDKKLFSAIKKAKTLDELYSFIKVKRFTLARVRRLVLSSFLGIDNKYFMKPLKYVRVLGFNKNGKEILSSASKNSDIPVITTVSQLMDLDEESKRIFEIETKATDLYALSFNEPFECGKEYTFKIIKED